VTTRSGVLRPAVPYERLVEAYGGLPEQVGEWWLPRAPHPLPLVVLVHGGFWRPGYDRHLQDAVAVALVDRGYAVWNIDYRSSVHDWPATFADAAGALDHVAGSPRAGAVDLARVAVVGHSAGGHLALWLASRHMLPDGATGAGPRVRPRLAVAQAPVADLVAGHEGGLGGGAVEALLQGTPAHAPDRYATGSPQALLPVPDVRLVLVHGAEDETVPPSQSEAYARAARAGQTDVDLRVLSGVGHYEHLDPGSGAVAELLDALEGL
jgi:acetyl esterase/lipase